jgi:FkbM family methyltransferase
MVQHSPTQIRRLDQSILNALVETPVNGLRSRARFQALRGVRRLRLFLSDPVVKYSLGTRDLLLPLSHELPSYRRAFPEYALNLGKVAFHLRRKYADLTMIDVGANVGDSAAIIRMHCDHPILCIEGEGGFFRLLAANARNLGEIELEQTFLGAPGDHVGSVHTGRGNARVILGSASGKENICTLGEVLSRHPRFAVSKLVKLDAEGFDCRIIACESEFLSRSKPVLFFEYYPACCEMAGQQAFPVFARLGEMGYATVLIYQNVGRYLTSLQLHQVRELASFHRYISDPQGFCDIVAFHSEDLDVARDIRAQALADAAIKKKQPSRPFPGDP